MTGLGRKTVLFIGHSLIEFFDWQARFPGQRVFNLGVAGETVEGLLLRTGRIISGHSEPDIVFLMTGINNVAMEDYEFAGDLKEIVLRLKAAWPKAEIFVHSLIPVVLEWVRPEDILKTNLKIKAVAEETGTGYIDIYGFFLDESGLVREELFLPDGVHLGEKGYALWSEALKQIIGK